MKLDSKIKSLSDILTCFDIEQAKQFIGEKGYFAKDLDCYCCLDKKNYGTLTEVEDSASPFKADNDCCLCRRYFLPESRLIETKKFRPYTFKEFSDKFIIGKPIKFRGKGDDGGWMWFVLTGYRESQYNDGNVTVTHVYIGACPFTLEELFDEYEWYDDDTKDFKPFGVEEK